MANELKNKRGLIKDRLTKLQHKVSRDEMSLGNKKKEEKGKAGLAISGSIRVQLSIAFLIPVIFIIMVGSISYSIAKRNLTETYTNATINALNMTAASLDDSMKIIRNSVSELSQDSTVKSYALGGFVGKSAQEDSARTLIDTSINVKQTSNDIILDIHLFPVEEEELLTTKNLGAGSDGKVSNGDNSFINEIKSSEDGYLCEDEKINWNVEHPYIDEMMNISVEDYALFCSKKIKSGKIDALIVVDVNQEAIRSLLSQLDFGAGSQVSLVVAGQKEISVGEVSTIVGTDFYKEAEEKLTANGDSLEAVSRYVSINGKSYFFMMYPMETLDGYVCALVPMAVITAGSDTIRLASIVMVIIAVIIAALISVIITRMITVNIKRSVSKLDKVSKGELILEEGSTNIVRNEFGKLQSAIVTTIDRMRTLILTVIEMIGVVSSAGAKVEDSSHNVGDVVKQMEERIDHIHDTIQSEDMQINSCIEQMEDLSTDIKTVSQKFAMMEGTIEESEALTKDGMNVVDKMLLQSKETQSATDEVQQQVTRLSEKIEEISKFADDIKDIAGQTNLLSLNASIEAARAGEQGKGFAVVASEIRKLADDSASAALTIQEVIGDVKAFSESAMIKSKTAEEIVNAQLQSATETEDMFQKLGSSMQSMEEEIRRLTCDIDAVNQKRHEAVKAVRVIGELSKETVNSADAVRDSLGIQIECTRDLEKEAEALRNNMGKLEQAVGEFKLNNDELAE